MTETRLDTFDYVMPSLGADMEEGSVIEWFVGVGDTVERGAVVARVETEKSDIDIEMWHGGIVEEIVVEPNRLVPVGTPLLRLRPTDAGVAPGAEPPAASRAVPAEMVRVGPSDATAWASPLARRLADERGIALADIIGSGPGGAIRERDLPGQRSLDQAGGVHGEPAERRQDDDTKDDTKDDAPPPRSRSDRMRSAIAARMTQSHREIPHYRLEHTVDLDALLRMLIAANEDRPMAERIVPAAAFVRAVALAAARHRELNGTWVDDQFRAGAGVNVAIAISLRTGGLVTPTLRNADEQNLDQLMSQIREFTLAARSGALRSEWASGDSTITITNLGDRGADLVHGLIAPPEVALVGFGRVVERPWVVDGRVVPRRLVTVTLAADHRATDGATGSRFLSTIAGVLENPEQL